MIELPEHELPEVLPADQPAGGEVVYCAWFALCDRPATHGRRGPIGDGRWGYVPICDRCNAKVEALS